MSITLYIPSHARELYCYTRVYLYKRRESVRTVDWLLYCYTQVSNYVTRLETIVIKRIIDLMRNLRCLIIGHDWQCLVRRHQPQEVEEYGTCWSSEFSGWVCFRCRKQRTEQWDF